MVAGLAVVRGGIGAVLRLSELVARLAYLHTKLSCTHRYIISMQRSLKCTRGPDTCMMLSSSCTHYAVTSPCAAQPARGRSPERSSARRLSQQGERREDVRVVEGWWQDLVILSHHLRVPVGSTLGGEDHASPPVALSQYSAGSGRHSEQKS